MNKNIVNLVMRNLSIKDRIHVRLYVIWDMILFIIPSTIPLIAILILLITGLAYLGLGLCYTWIFFLAIFSMNFAKGMTAFFVTMVLLHLSKYILAITLKVTEWTSAWIKTIDH